ncbi:AraC family transcriptional regulator [Methylopila sp. Yamaguchi]|uniref:AraC family transcriptional regulator n=1 Tax=Methylopila sp. Yamaguchi TaxID=1437817 RepID=UPI000CA9A270|nr:AraC family transcriptional regulator [Methylopila sp. Yamaguchi]GBD47896.1 transcriptional regulator protein [Methylopila sp. Yamaguchi]
MAAFRPRMESRRDGIEVVDGWRRTGASGCVELWRANCASGASGDYVSQDPRLFVVLEPLAAPMAFREAGRQVAVSTGSGFSFVPAGVRLSSRFAGATSILHLDVHLSAEWLREMIGEDGALTEPRLMASDERALSLARMLAAECASATPLPPLYGDSLTAALISAAMGATVPVARKRSGLPKRKLDAAIGYIEAHCGRPIRLQELADLTGMTQSHFSHAFKAATGVPPHRWQMQARIRKAQELLTRSDASLTEIAAETGFSDQPHFTRVFRQIIGRTPAAWRDASS